MLTNHSPNPADIVDSTECLVATPSGGNRMGKTLSGRSPLKYRADIDGLRAVAVLSVLAFHIRLRGVQGGFVGVDVFFVISGYLISSIVFTEIAESRYSMIGFYERRIRRIFPALFAMLALVSVVAARYLLPAELVAYGKSMLAATASASNFYFWRHSGYFDSPDIVSAATHLVAGSGRAILYLVSPFSRAGSQILPYSVTAIGDHSVLCVVGRQRGCRLP